MDFYEQLLNDYENVPAISLHADDSFDFKEPGESVKTKIPVKTLKKRPANEELSKPSKKTITLPMLPAATTTAKLPAAITTAKLPATTTTKKTTTKPKLPATTNTVKPPTTNITSISKKSNIKPKLPTTTMTPAASISRPTSTATKKSTTKPKLTPTANPVGFSTTSKPPPATRSDSHPIITSTLNRPLWFPEFQEEMKKITTAMNNNSRENQLIADSINNHNLSMGLVANKLQVLCGNIATLNTTIKEQSTNQTDMLTKIGEISDTLSKTVSELKPTETYNRGQSPDRGFRRQLLSGLSH